MASALPRSILVVGYGGREHTFVRALLDSPGKPRIVCGPGNAGIAQDVACFPIADGDIAGLVALVHRVQIELAVVGSEVPLSIGLVDALEKLAYPPPAVPKATWARGLRDV